MEITLIIVLNLDDKYIEIIKRRVDTMSTAKLIVDGIGYFFVGIFTIGGAIGIILAVLAMASYPLMVKLAKLIDYIKRAL